MRSFGCNLAVVVKLPNWWIHFWINVWISESVIGWIGCAKERIINQPVNLIILFLELVRFWRVRLRFFFLFSISQNVFYLGLWPPAVYYWITAALPGNQRHPSDYVCSDSFHSVRKSVENKSIVLLLSSLSSPWLSRSSDSHFSFIL